MQTKTERFQKWRGSKAGAEQNYLATALSIASYVDATETLDTIKADLHSPEAQKFIEFDHYKERALGSVLFSKLVVDEACEQFPVAARNTPFFELLKSLSAVTAMTYQQGRGSEKDVNLVFKTIDQLLALDATVLADQQQEKKLLFSLYTILQIIRLSLDSLGVIARAVVGRIINIEKVVAEAESLLLKIEEKAKLLQEKQKSPPGDELKPTALQQFENYFKQRYLKILNAIPPKTEKKSINALHLIKKLSLLQQDMHEIVVSLARLITLRKNNKDLQLRIKPIDSLLGAAKMNDERIFGRKYFLDFIKENQKFFTVLMDNVSDAQKAPLLTKMSELISAVEEQALPIKLIYGLSWLTTPITGLYRALTPQAVQDGIVTRIPLTLDSECKVLLKELAQSCLLDLNKELTTQDLEIKEITTQLFVDDEVLKELIKTEPLETLEVLQKGTEEAHNSLQTYSALLLCVKTNMDFLHQYRLNSQTLKEFIRVNDDFWVLISNFFAQICTFFKTDTAKLIDVATECTKKVDNLCSKYQHAIEQEMQHIEEDPTIPPEIKNQLKEHFITEVNDANRQKASHSSIKKRHVRLLIRSLSELFDSEPSRASQNKDDEKEYKDDEDGDFKIKFL